MTAAQLVGFVLASVHAAVVVWVVWAILFNSEPAWPMYWSLAVITSMPFSLVFVGAERLSYKGIPLRRKLAFTESEMQRAIGASERATQSQAVRPPVDVPVEPAVRGGGIAWDRAMDFRNFQLPFLLLGVGGVLWWYFVPQWAAAAFHAVS